MHGLPSVNEAPAHTGNSGPRKPPAAWLIILLSCIAFPSFQNRICPGVCDLHGCVFILFTDRLRHLLRAHPHLLPNTTLLYSCLYSVCRQSTTISEQPPQWTCMFWSLKDFFHDNLFRLLHCISKHMRLSAEEPVTKAKLFFFFALAWNNHYYYLKMTFGEIKQLSHQTHQIV